MRLLLDSSALLTYLASPNRERSAIFAMLQIAAYLDVTLVWSDRIEQEIRSALRRKPALLRAVSVEDAEATLSLLHAVLDKAPALLGPPERVCRDPNDDVIVAAALAGACNAVVTLDHDLLSLVEHRGVLFVKPGGALELLRNLGPPPRA